MFEESKWYKQKANEEIVDRLHRAESVMSKLYKRNLQLEEEVRNMSKAQKSASYPKEHVRTDTDEEMIPFELESKVNIMKQLLVEKDENIKELQTMIEGVRERYGISLRKEVNSLLRVEMSALQAHQNMLTDQLRQARIEMKRYSVSEGKARKDYNKLLKKKVKEFSLDPHGNIFLIFLNISDKGNLTYASTYS